MVHLAGKPNRPIDVIAIENGIKPSEFECIGWKIHPMIGGEFSVDNLQVFDMQVYQSLMSQLHARIQGAERANS